ncbi:sulfatase-like hydrolase/transferase [Streptomyces sp. NPDC048623]|uniref:sulfatase-like hydrolase/transferase n=1 Tax=Streptomyces sp. NPDC048623 TaxID=3155761 RepID=UPI0034186D7A
MPTSRPGVSVIVVLTDQQRWDTTGTHGNPAGVTPEFDRLAREGTLVEQAIAPNPGCGPARAALQTGRFPTATGVYRSGLPLGAEIPTLAGAFGAAGYVTGYIGAWHLAGAEYADGPVPVERRGGYQRWLASERPAFASGPYRTVLYDEAGEPVRLPGDRPDGADRPDRPDGADRPDRPDGADEADPSDGLIGAAIRFVADHHDRPFLLFLSLPESPHQHATAARVERLDAGVRRLRDRVRGLGIENDTVFVWTAGHGAPGRSAHDASVRVPFVLTGPGFRGGGRIRQPVSTVDLMPTLLDAAGIAVPAGVHGRSLRPLLDGGTERDRPFSVFVQISEGAIGRAVRTDRWKYVVTAPDGTDVPDSPDAWREGCADRYREAELYDLAADPYETRNLAGLTSHRCVADGLRDALGAWLKEVEGAAPVIEAAPPRAPEGVRFGRA